MLESIKRIKNGVDSGVLDDKKYPTDDHQQPEDEHKVDKNVLEQVDSILKIKPHEIPEVNLQDKENSKNQKAERKKETEVVPRQAK